MKKFFTFIFLFALVLSLVACGGDKDNNVDNGGSDDAEINFDDLK